MRPPPRPPRKAPPPYVSRPRYETLDHLLLAFLALCAIGGLALGFYMLAGGRP